MACGVSLAPLTIYCHDIIKRPAQCNAFRSSNIGMQFLIGICDNRSQIFTKSEFLYICVNDVVHNCKLIKISTEQHKSFVLLVKGFERHARKSYKNWLNLATIYGPPSIDMKNMQIIHTIKQHVTMQDR